MSEEILTQLAPGGTLRAGLNLANHLLITGAGPGGEPEGVAPDMAKEIAARLGVEFSLVPFPSPGEVADQVANDVWDICMIGAEAERAKTICFTAAYVEIEATYLVAADSPFTSADEVDREGVRIAVSGRSAYDLYLDRNLQHAELVRAKGVAGAAKLFVTEKLDALAGLRPALITEAEKIPGARIVDGAFTAVQQAVGCRPGDEAGAAFLRDFVEEAKASGLVASLIERHGVVGRLSVAQPG